MTGEYTFVAPERQNELTRRIQQKLAAESKQDKSRPASPAQEVPLAAGNGQDQVPLATTLIQ